MFKIPESSPLRLAVAIATYRRVPELLRLLRGLREVPAKVVIADNAADPSLPEIVRAERLPMPVEILPLSTNEGPGTAWAEAIALLQKHGGFDACLVLDDDVVLDAQKVMHLLETQQSMQAEIVAPLLSDATGQLWGFPEPRDPQMQKEIRLCRTPAEALQRLGSAPVDAVWCTGACLLVTGRAFAECGSYRRDFFMLGEDLEFTMRVAARLRVVFDPRCEVPHLPPTAPDSSETLLVRHRKFCALLQNLSYLSFHVPHRHHMRRYLAGNFKRFFTQRGLHAVDRFDGIFCFYAGAIAGQPAGGPLGRQLRARIARRFERHRGT